MQTLRKRTSPCKYKNDPSRFLGEGITFKAKLIGILEVSEARGDKMCQDALNDLKTAIRAAGEHKQRITISISIDGLRLRDEKTGDCLYHHPVHKISFIAQDMSDSRAFGYIFGSPDTGHRFFGIKTDKTASQVVISMRDLFQVVFELKKKEIEMAKHHTEQHHAKYGSTGYVDSVHFSKDESESDKGKGKYSQILKSRCPATSKSGESSCSDLKGSIASEAIADLLDLEHELNSIQQGINQMDKITPSDPFGPLSKGDSSYVDPFDDSFSSKIERQTEEKASATTDRLPIKNQICSHPSEERASDLEKHSSFFPSTASSGKTHFFSQFSPGMGKSKADDDKWFDRETESLFDETVNVNNSEPTSSPVASNAPASETEQADGKKSPIKTDLFTELDPLGTGRVKPYVDKKDFFQELKNPPKKVLKEMISSDGPTTAPELSTFYFPARHFKDGKTPTNPKSESDSARSSTGLDSCKEDCNPISRYGRIDPFDDGDPFEKTDPFEEENFPASIGFPPLFAAKTSSVDGIFDEKPSWKTSSKDKKENERGKASPANLSLFSSGTLRVSLPPEKTDGTCPVFVSSATSDSPDDAESLRRKFYQSLKQSTLGGSEESPVREEPFVICKATDLGSKNETETRSPFKDRFYGGVGSPPTGSRAERTSTKISSGVEILDAATTPDPPPRATAALFSIKPPPLPPKKLSQSSSKPPARPPSSTEEAPFHYDYLKRQQDVPRNGFQVKDELKCVKLKKSLFPGKDSPPPPSSEIRKQSSEFGTSSGFPVLPPPPNRKNSGETSGKPNAGRRVKSGSSDEGSILNIKLNQLDNTGLESLAITLGIPSENIYSMTLQELTKMLSVKYLTSTETKAENTKMDSFEVDFDANFAKTEPKPPPTYDKYAVFKELMESESNADAESVRYAGIDDSVGKEDENSGKADAACRETAGEEEEDRYAALRQLSVNARDNFREDLEDEEDNAKTEDVSGRCGLSVSKEDDSRWSSKTEEADGENLETNFGGDGSLRSGKLDRNTNPEQENSKDVQFSSESRLFPSTDRFSEEDKKQTVARDNWATFDKSDFGEEPAEKKLSDNFNENENSPFSSDGKEEVREIPFHWHRNAYGKKIGKDVPWQDDEDEDDDDDDDDVDVDDESWDDYSPKESFCSDESSREERSPDAGREDRYDEKASWKVRGRPSKSERPWNERSGRWNRRDKWQEETEDEFEETWRKQRERAGSYESERKNDFWHGNSYDNYEKRYEWGNGRSEPWDENERRVHCYGSRRKRSESDNEYRKRCDSDASDKECVWTFQKNYSEARSRRGGGGGGGKQKQYYDSGRSFRERPEHCHESRSKRRKGASQKRPSSASESKRNYEKIFSAEDHSFRNVEKTYPSKREPEKEEFSRYQYAGRHRSDLEFSRGYSSYDRKTSGHPTGKTGGTRASRGSDGGQTETFPSKRVDPTEYFEPFGDKSHGNKYDKTEVPRHYRFGDEHSPREDPRSPERRTNRWASTNGKTDGDGFFSVKNNNENFADFGEDNFKISPKKTKDDGKRGESLSHPKNKNHLAALARQESSTTLRKSDSVNIFSRDKDPFEGDDFFSSVS